MGESSRKLTLGIDTGGTYTDAVLYEECTATVVAKAKAPTTHDELAAGIGAAIDGVLAAATAMGSAIDAATVEMVVLSTTLATNALVEGTGRPACLVAIGFDSNALDRGGLRGSLGDDEVIIVGGGHNSHGDELEPLDLALLASQIDEVADDVEGFAVIAQFATRNPIHELAARDLIRDRTGKPVTCSHHLSSRLNGPKRGVTALLNARLIPLIEGLVVATAATLADRGVDAPILIVKGDGSLVSVELVRDRPVETIFSGPAASLIGAAHLVGSSEAIIADIGGTTTDILVLSDGDPGIAPDGATVGGHQTMVEAVMIHTHGLGGDSEVGVNSRGQGAGISIGPRRVVPLSVLADLEHDRVLEVLRRQLGQPTPGLHDGRFVSTTARAADARLDPGEQELIDSIGREFVAIDSVLSSGLHQRALGRLVGRSLLRVGAFTPTDAAHVLGLQATADPEAAQLGAALLARQRDRFGAAIAEAPEELATLVVDALVRRSGEAILSAALARDGLSATGTDSELVEAALDGRAVSSRVDIGIAVPLVGLGAPASTYYPAVGALLGAEVEIPDHADVANAIGAAVGEVRVSREVVVTAPRRGVYRVHAGGEPETVWEHLDAKGRALEIATAAASAAVVEAGAGSFEVATSWQEKTIDVGGRPMFVEGSATAVASGRPRL